MLAIDDPLREPSTDLLDQRGGFLWWYVDACNDAGDGFVCIWAWGLPFLPGLASSGRRGCPTRLGDRPSVNLAIYHGGRAVAWHLLELQPEDVQRTDDGERWGPCTFRYRRTPGDTELRAEINLPIPGQAEPLSGTFHMAGPPASTRSTPPPTSPHRWTPLLGPATVHARFHVGEQQLLELEGSGYHDRNRSPVGLDELGIKHWIWGRVRFADHIAIFYLSWSSTGAEPTLVVGRLENDGHLDLVTAEVHLGRPRWGRFGMPWWNELRISGLRDPLHVHVDPPVDDGPFYLRHRIRATCAGATGQGWAELCRPARVDLACHRPLVRMSVQSRQAVESMWLPLFAGPQRDRWTRLLRWWSTGRALGTSRLLEDR